MFRSNGVKMQRWKYFYYSLKWISYNYLHLLPQCLLNACLAQLAQWPMANGRIYRPRNFIAFVLCMTIIDYYFQ